MDTPSNSEAPSNHRQRNNKYLRCIAHMDSTLTNVLLDQHNVGNHYPNGWKDFAYMPL